MTRLFDAVSSLQLTSPLLEKKGHFVVEETLGTGLLFATAFLEEPRDFAIVATNQYSAQRLYEFLLNFLPEENVVFFPNDELLRAEALASSRELLSQRLYALGQLRSKGKKILVTHPSALLRYLPDPKRFEEETIQIKVGDSLDLPKLKARLANIGYSYANRVDRSLQFSSRGDILDVYCVSYLDPIRIEFFGDEIDSIRLFDPRSQESKGELKSASILPASDLFLNDDELSDFLHRANEQIEKDRGALGEDAYELLKQNCGRDFEDFVTHNYRSELYKYFGFAVQTPFSVLDYFKPSLVYFTNRPQFETSCNMLRTDAAHFYADLFYKAKVFSGIEQFMPVEKAVKSKSKCVFSDAFATSSSDTLFPVHKISCATPGLAGIVPTIETYLSTCEKVVLCLNEPQQKKTVLGFLEDAKIEHEDVDGFCLPEGRLGISGLPLSEGFEIPGLKIAYISSGELFGQKGRQSRFTSRFKNATVLRSYEDLKPGDYVVHEYNGIGQFLDIKTIEVDGVHRDFLHIAYAGNEYLYVPLEQFRLVRKYAGREGVAPKLSRISSGEWEKRKSKIKERVNELADRLVALYGARAKLEGYAFPPDDDLQTQFENEFPHELTPDQAKAVAEIKADMEKPEIMDRLVCGDVGFGKTEVAFRAVFKAINSGKQVALLCPTTLLARQHYEVAVERFRSFGVRIAVLSRLVPESDQAKTIEKLHEGTLDFVIGTHRLLSKLIQFKDLGLLVIDEEQRFGVEQKERIKEMKQTVDVLTLSATPIPRTLQMSLVGIRPLSEINTAPSSRMPIQTYVTPFDQSVVDELLQRELARNGQVFYVHNKVATIYAVASKMAGRIPSARIGVVHGQMDKDEIEDVMGRFYDNELNVLVCTSIVENGIDIPNANMIIVEDADTFGLSQLYQIKGRVGRGDRIAYAYLLYRPQKNMKEESMKRLQAIQEFTELGSGYKIAQRDLMIRGAGDILGPEQAGFIDSVGLDLYLKMLQEAVEAKKSGTLPEPPKPTKMFRIDAYIPKGYASNADKIELYQELEDIKDAKGLAAFSAKVRDIHGRLPEEVHLLIQKKRIDLLSENPEFLNLEETEGCVNVVLEPSFSCSNGLGVEIFNALHDYIGILRASFLEKKLKLTLRKREGKWLNDLEAILNAIHKIYLRRQNQC